MAEKMRFRLVADRARKSKMDPEYKCILDLAEPVSLTNTVQILGTKERNGNILVEIQPYYENLDEKVKRQKMNPKKPIKKSGKA
ncbi:MAG: hypothetical protein R2804_18660 [Cyclobacteriaceae bacterium]